MTIIEQFTGREAGPLVQFIKYCVCGGIATTTHIIIFHIAAWKLFPALQPGDIFVKFFKIDVPTDMDDRTRARHSMLDNVSAFVFSNLVAYLLNVMWVFTPGRHHWAVELGLFYLVSAVSLFIGTTTMGILIQKFSLRTTTAFLANLVSALLINYAMRKFVIFKH